MKTLETDGLCVTDNVIGDEGAKLLSESLKVNTTLLHLKIFSLELIEMNDEKGI